MKIIEKVYKNELSYYPGESSYEKLLAFLLDLGNYADYFWDIPKMQYDLVKSDEEWAEFRSHPERKPYQLKVLEWREFEVSELYTKVLEVAKNTISVIKKSKKADEQMALKKALAPIIRGILHARYTIESMHISDQYRGVTQEMRSNGDMYITQVQQANFNFYTSVTAIKLDKPVEYIREKLLTICGGHIARISEFLMTCQFDDEIKEICVAYRDIASADNSYEDYGMILAYKVWRELYDAGINLDTFLSLIGYPNAKTIKRKLLAFLGNKDMHKEVIEHLKAERPTSYKTYKKQGWINMIDVDQEEARLLNFPKNLRSTEETQKMIDQSIKKISGYFPISRRESPRQLLFAPIHPFANKRAYQSQTYNSEEQAVNIVVMTPTVDSSEEFLKTLAHETTHAIHSIILKLGNEYGILTKQQADQVPIGVLEDFSQLVEGQFQEKQESTASTKSYKGKIFASFNQSQGSRWQAPYGLLQIEVREQFEKWIKDGVVTLTARMIDELRVIYNKKVDQWWETGLKFRISTTGALSWVSALSPDDGLVYMKKFIVTSKKSRNNTKNVKSKRELSMSEAFTKRFGHDWIETQDARILLYWLLLETGRNHETDKYGEIILNKDIRECLEELQKISIDASEFSMVGK